MNVLSDTSNNRRSFIKTAVGTALGTSLLGGRLLAHESVTEPASIFTKYGINAKFPQAAAAKAAGADYLLMGVNNFLKPNGTEAQFEDQLALQEKSPIPVLTCNGFLKGDALRSVGPDAKPDNVLKFAEKTFKRAKIAGVRYIVFGSSGSRRIPEGWTKEKADEQFISLLKQMGPLAQAEGIMVTVENLQAKECNYLKRIGEVGEIIREVDHPNIKVLADLYHGSVMQDPPDVLAEYIDVIEMIEIAEAKGRTAPGVNGQDFRPYFKVLKDNGYHGPIEIEGRWKVDQLPLAFKTIREQAAEA